AFYARVKDQGVNDLKQMLVDGFYESALPVVLRPGQFARYLASLEALIMLDDVSLGGDDLLELMDSAYGSVFVVAGEARLLRGEGRSLGLGGLADEEAVELMERELGCDLNNEERAAAATICQALDGHPASILAEAARIREEGLGLAAAAAELQPEPSGKTATERLQDKTTAELSPAERQLAALLQVMADVPLHQEHIQAVAGRADVPATLQALQSRQLAQAHSPSYTLTAPLQSALLDEEGQAWSAKLLTHFVEWTDQVKDQPDLLQARLDAILQVMAWGRANGRWVEVLALARNCQDALALARRWDAWRGVLEGALQAAQALEQPADEAWALHQLGTRDLCLGNEDEARARLLRALRLREALGQSTCAAATRHNLQMLRRRRPLLGWLPTDGQRDWWRRILGALLLGLLILLLLLLLRPDDAVVGPDGAPASPTGIAGAFPSAEATANPTVGGTATAEAAGKGTIVPSNPDRTATAPTITPNGVSPQQIVHDEPVAVSDSVTTLEDAPVTVAVLANDRLPATSSDLTLSILELPRWGAATLTADDRVRYQPAADYFGEDSFRYQVCTADDRCSGSSVIVQVTSVNDLPLAGPDQAVVNRGGQVLIAVLENDSDAEDLVVRLTRLFLAANGSVTEAADQRVRYEPDFGYCGPDRFRYQIADSEEATSTGLVTVEVRCTNQAPQVRADALQAIEDQDTILDVLANDFDADGNLLPDTLSVPVGPAHGQVEIQAGGLLRYIPNPNYAGADDFTYRVCDQAQACGQAQVTLTVAPVPDRPQAADDTAAVTQGSQVSIAVLANDGDADGDPLQVVAVTQPVNGQASVAADSRIIYAPAAAFCGQTDTFSYTAADPGGLTDQAAVTVSVACTNQSPVAQNDSASVDFGLARTIAVLTNDSDPDPGDSLTLTSVSAPGNGSAVVVAGGQQVQYTPQAGFTGPDAFTYQVCDQRNGCSSAQVSVQVLPPKRTLGAFWRADRLDFWTTRVSVAGLFCHAGNPYDPTYQLVRFEGVIFDLNYNQPPGAILLTSYWNSGMEDYLTAAGGNPTVPDGYDVVRQLGYIYGPADGQPPNTIPVYSYYNPNTGDYLLTGSGDPNAWGYEQGYQDQTLVGYVQVSPCQ
ncbi:MAG: Ig-like domain-containing protein, partial [Candidatus Promineifilaceae bacterium]|nr:Ig-like domain-containing protein [Candidatus Promineifilaceae bacterium]